MTTRWHNPQTERLVAAHLAGNRPAFVWTGDSERLVWRNRAGRAFEAAHRRKPHDMLVPVPRQVPRTLRMGVPFRPSPARLQFALGRRPISETCTCTPVLLADNQPALLVVMRDPLAEGELATAAFAPEDVAPFLPEAAHFVLTGHDGNVLLRGGDGEARLTARQAPDMTLSADADGTSHLIVFPATAPALDAPVPQDSAPEVSPETEAVSETADDEATQAHEDGTETVPSEDGLVSLLDRLDSRQVLYQPLDDSDDAAFLAPAIIDPVAPEVPQETAAATEDETPVADEPVEAIDESEPPEADTETESDMAMAEAPMANDTAPDAPAEDPASVPVRLWRVIGRELMQHADGHVAKNQDDDKGPATTEDETDPDESEADAPEVEEASIAGLIAAADGTEPETSDAPEENAVIERTTRYNFDELSRILTDRVSSDANAGAELTEDAIASGAGALVNLGDETLILNRLPIGLLVFRDQQILFSNRALTDLLGYVDGTSLRRAGLAGVFPPEGDQDAAGPVTKLMGADGRVLSVAARLQTISWQGKPALLLSASRQKEPLNAEDLARGFAEFLANAIDCGYFESSRAGMLTSVSGRAALLAGRSPEALIGRPLHGLIAVSQAARLRAFLEKPARFAGVDRPMERLAGAEPGTEVIVFAEGMAGIVTGYFGLVRRIETSGAEDAPRHDIDTAFLTRLGRAVRQPVNAIVGFAEMIRSQTFGPIGNDRYADYAKFIHSAGLDIASVVDELESYARLNESTYEVETDRIDLGELLESCVTRVRPFASSVRVLVRSGISSNLPEISADRQTLTQAVLNVLASAVAHSPHGGQVVLSAQKRADDAVEVHVRDSGPSDALEIDDRFVVFRDGKTPDGESLAPIPSTIGLALTNSLLAVNAATLEITPSRGNGTLSSLTIPADRNETADSAQR